MYKHNHNTLCTHVISSNPTCIYTCTYMFTNATWTLHSVYIIPILCTCMVVSSVREVREGRRGSEITYVRMYTCWKLLGNSFVLGCFVSK